MMLCQVKQTASSLTTLPGVAHGFFGMPQNDPGLDKEATFRRQCVEACDELNADSYAHVHQVHGRDVVRVSNGQSETLGEADAMVTDGPGVALIIKTADCVPVLFADPQAQVIGAAHAGWRGALAGVLQETLAAMAALGARLEHVHAAIGPAIHQPSYEVGAAFKEQFLAQNARADRFFSDKFGPKAHFDLPGFCQAALHESGIAGVQLLPIDTRDEKNGFFSHRRSCQHPESRYGRNASVIALQNT